MQLESAKYLEDIREAGQTVLQATAGRTLDDYLRDKLLRLAVERCFEIIGEALRRLDERDHEISAGCVHGDRISLGRVDDSGWRRGSLFHGGDVPH